MDEAVKSFARDVQRQLCGYDGEAASIREAQIEDVLYKHFGKPVAGRILDDDAGALLKAQNRGFYITVLTGKSRLKIDREYAHGVVLFVKAES